MRFYLFSCLLWTGFSYSQEYIQLLNTDNEWHVTACDNGCITDEYYVQEDTLYNGYSYKILNAYHFISKTFWLREDIEDRKVLMSYQEVGKARTEVVLYDFGLNVGDSIEITNPISPFPKNPGYFKVDSIQNYSLFDGLLHRFLYLSPAISSLSSEYPIWVEGIGSLNLINAPGGTPDISGIGKLSCFIKNGILIYSDLDSISSCEAKFITSTVDVKINSLKVYPTLVTRFFNLENLSPFSSIKLFNIYGEMVYKRNTNETTSLKIDLSILSPGVYFVKISPENNSTTYQFKIIKH